MNKAKLAREETNKASAKEQAILSVTEELQNYYNGKYVTNSENTANAGEYIEANLNNKQEGSYIFEVGDDTIEDEEGTEETKRVLKVKDKKEQELAVAIF